MYCSKCATEIPDDANFCYKCAHPVAGSFNPQPVYIQQVKPNGEARRQEMLYELDNFEQSRQKPKQILNTETPTAVGNFIASIVYLILGGLLIIGLLAFLIKLRDL